MNLGVHTASSDPTTYPFGDRTASGELRCAVPEKERGETWSFELLAAGNRKNAVATGYASWAEPRSTVTRMKFSAVMDSISRFYLAGMDGRNFAAMLVALHERVEGLDGHFYWYQRDLVTGRPVSFICWDRDKHALWDLADIWNLRERWTSPRDGSLNFLRGQVPETLQNEEDQRSWRQFDRQIVRLVRSTKCISRHEFLSLLERAGISIVKKDQYGISIQDGNGTTLEFFGGKFAEDFDFAGIGRRIAEAREVWWREAPQRLPALEQRYEKFFAERCELFRKCHPAAALDPYPRTRGERCRADWRTRVERDQRSGIAAAGDLRLVGEERLSGFVAGQIGNDTVLDGRPSVPDSRGQNHAVVGEIVANSKEARKLIITPVVLGNPSDKGTTYLSGLADYANYPRPIAVIASGLERIHRGTADAVRQMGGVAAANAERAAALHRSICDFENRLRRDASAPSDTRGGPSAGAYIGCSLDRVVELGNGRGGEPEHIAREPVFAGAARAPEGLSIPLAKLRDLVRTDVAEAIKAARTSRILGEIAGMEPPHIRDR